jgi:cyclic-di-GMP-binding protein
MAGESSFDIVSDFDRQELVNAVDQTQREMRQRYDLKSANASIELEKDAIVISAPSDMVLKSVIDVLESKMVRRGLDLKVLDFGPVEPASGGTVRQRIGLKRGISQDLGRTIVKLIRDNAPKAKAQIQGDAVRVSSKSKDELQQVQQVVKQQGYDVPIQFNNYR